jgi:hypothetical protein
MSATALDIVRSEALSVRAVRTAYGVWHEAILALVRAKREFANLGEHTQAEALAKDAEHITRRAMRHLKRMQMAANTNGGE